VRISGLLAALIAALLAITAPTTSARAQFAGGSRISAVVATATPAAVVPIPAPVVLPLERAGLKGVAAHWWFLERYGSPLLDHFVTLGVTSVRLTVDWLQIEPAEGQMSFQRLDPFMDAFQARGIEVVPVVATIPAWASLNPDQCRPENSMLCYLNPEKLSSFEASMRRLVVRYPEVRRWEFWNEPEMWLSMRDGDRYEPWYRAFYRAAKQANPSARVAVGTLTGWDFFRQLSPSVPVDAVSVHSYAGEHWGLDTQKIVRLHEGLRVQGRNVPIWLTEYGWDSRWMDHATRASMLAWVAKWALAQPWLELAHYHMLHDTEDPRECCYGLVGGPPTFSPKQPAYDAFRSIAVEGWAERPRLPSLQVGLAMSLDPASGGDSATALSRPAPRLPRAE
jgi:hypothetical protein